MGQLIYEKPSLINLSEKTHGQVSIQGICYNGTWPGPFGDDYPPGSLHCTNGLHAKGVADSYCQSGSDPGTGPNW